MDSDLKIAAVNTKPMAIEEIGSDEERKTRLRRKKETLGMDDTLEVHLTRGSEGSDARGSRDPVAHPVETAFSQRTAPDLVLWSDEPGGLLEPAQEERPRESVTIVQIWQRKLRTSSRTRVSATELEKEPEFPIIMVDYCVTQDARGCELFTILDM